MSKHTTLHILMIIKPILIRTLDFVTSHIECLLSGSDQVATNTADGSSTLLRQGKSIISVDRVRKGTFQWVGLGREISRSTLHIIDETECNSLSPTSAFSHIFNVRIRLFRYLHQRHSQFGEGRRQQEHQWKARFGTGQPCQWGCWGEPGELGRTSTLSATGKLSD